MKNKIRTIDFLVNLFFWDSKHVQQSKYTVFHEESDFQVKNSQFLDPEGKSKEKRTTKNLYYLSI